MKKARFILLLLIGLAAYFGIMHYFLTTPGDKINDYPQLTGSEVLALMNPSFWVFVIICAVIAIILIVAIYANETGNTILGNKLSGQPGLSLFLAIIVGLLLFLPWIPAAENKANAGVTAPHFKNLKTESLKQ